MTILTPTIANNFDYISRLPLSIDYINIFEEGTKQTITIPLVDITTSGFSWYDNVQFNDASLFLKDGYRYLISLYDIGNTLLWQDTVFCTSQPISTFSVNDGQYIYNQTVNQFIMYGQ